MSTVDYLTSLPNEILALINHRLELPDKAALSKTCRALFHVVKSNNAALKDLEYLREHYIDFGYSDYQISPKLYEAVQKQELADRVQMNDEDESIFKEKESEAKKAGLEIGVTEDGPVAQRFLKKVFYGTLEKASGVWERLTKILKKQLIPDGRDIFSEKTYKNNIEQQKLIIICNYIDLHKVVFTLNYKDSYKRLFRRELKVLDINRNPSEVKDRDKFLQISNELYYQIAVCLIFQALKIIFPEALESFISMKAKSDKEIIAFFNTWVKDNAANFVAKVNSSENQNILHILISYAKKCESSVLMHIWATHFFKPIFNVIPKENIFKYLTSADISGKTPLIYASLKSSNKFFNKNGNTGFVRYLLNSVEPDKRASCVFIKVNRRETVFQNILRNTEDLNLIKTILETLFKDPAELRGFLKENINSFNFASDKSSELKSWIASKLIEEDISNFDFGTLYSILSFNLKYGNIKNIAKALGSIKNTDLRKELIFRLFQHYPINEESKEFLYIFEIIYLLPDASQVEFIKLIDYKILKIIYQSSFYDTKYLEVSVEELYKYFCETLKTEVAVGNYDPFINGFMKGNSEKNLIECFELIENDKLKELIIENFDFEANKKVINALFSQLNKDEKIKALKNHVFSKNVGNYLNFYKFLDSHELLYEALIELRIKFNPNKNSSLIQFLLHDQYFLIDKKEKCLFFIFEALKTRTTSEIIDLLMKAVLSIKYRTKYKELLNVYSENRIKKILDEYFPGILARIKQYVDELINLHNMDRKKVVEYLVEEEQKKYRQLTSNFPNFQFHLDNIFPNIVKNIEDEVKRARIEANETTHEEDPRARKKSRVEKA